MLSRELLRVDLNLLISLQVLLEERNVSRAAERLFITQPAMSKTLGRLRDVFGDPLFTRGSHGMQPTPRALEIGESLDGVLQDIDRLLTGPDFDPASYRGEVVIAVSEYIGIWLLPRLMSRVSLSAPGLAIKTITRVEQQLQNLADGNLDISIHLKQSRYGDEFIWQSLGRSRPVLLMRQDHPLLETGPNWEDILRYPLVRLYISDQGDVEMFQAPGSATRLLNESRERGGFETSHLLTALEVLRNTDYLMPAPPFLLDNPAVAYRIASLSLPANVSDHIEYVLVRHRRTEHSAVHSWLWQQVTEVLLESRDPTHR